MKKFLTWIPIDIDAFYPASRSKFQSLRRRGTIPLHQQQENGRANQHARRNIGTETIGVHTAWITTAYESQRQADNRAYVQKSLCGTYLRVKYDDTQIATTVVCA